MSNDSTQLPIELNCLIALGTVASGGPLSITVSNPSAPQTEGFRMGASRAPDGSTITIDSESLLLDGRPWAPVMGEFQYTRYPPEEWRKELLKMKAGGITILSTYVFWIHHEEIEGEWTWFDGHDLHEFVRLAGSVGLKVVVRCGPWCHGEARNGGFPEWLVKKGWNLRSVDSRYLERVRIFYEEVAKQIRGELWKYGGPVIGIQLDNEYEGAADYMIALKRIAMDVGLDVPIYTRTGWTQMSTAMPFGEIVPLYSAYAEGFWSRQLTSMPGNFWAAFRFSLLRFDDNIVSEQLGRKDVRDDPDLQRYPYLTCEIGGGMMSSYHRRILINPKDVESATIIKLGSGSTLLGYYVYHGGTNPDGKLTTLMEAQDTLLTNYNDLPIKNYDFQAPIGEFGQLRPHYHLLRRLNLFLLDFGSAFARMPAAMPDLRPETRGDTTTLRWAVRSDGMTGYVFVNNYERSLEMPSKPGVQFTVNLPSGPLTFPATPIGIPADSVFYWPFNFDLGHGVRLSYATAVPICAIDDSIGRSVFFSETRGVPSQFAVVGEVAVRSAAPGRNAAFDIAGRDGKRVRVVLLSEADSLSLWKGSFLGTDRVFLTRAGLVLDGDVVRLNSSDRSELTVGIYPAPSKFSMGERDGIFTRYSPPAPPAINLVASFVKVRDAGPPREIPIGKISEPVATEPSDADFGKAAVWSIKLPANIDMASNPILRIHYVGDVARLTLNGRLLVDDFYNGNPFDFGLRRYAPQITDGELQFAVLPLRKDAIGGGKQRIFIADAARPDFGMAQDLAVVEAAEIIPSYEVRLSVAEAR
jgi:beta-galactosidase